MGRVPSTGQVLLKLEPKTLSQLLHSMAATHGIALSRRGSPQTFEKVVSRLSAEKMPVVIIGAFPHGHFTEATTNLADEVICIDAEMLEAWTMTSRIIYEYERTISLPLKRLERMDTASAQSSKFCAREIRMLEVQNEVSTSGNRCYGKPYKCRNGYLHSG